jgi:myo-inositol 2-dehydrogenase / D-chiro-inositol 1-dehydrogenase
MSRNEGNKQAGGASRRHFLKTSAAAISAAGFGAPTVGAGAWAAGSDAIRVGVIGCGGRGTEAATNAMSADKGVRIVAMGDVLLDRAQEKRNVLKVKYPDQVTATDDQCFSGFDSYKKVIELSDVVLIANAAKFHPMHSMAAVQAGRHVFVEKPHAIDPAGIKTVRAACDLATQKRLCILSGLQSRYHLGYRETIQRVHDGAIGEIVAIEENFLRAPYVLYPRRPGLTEVEYQGSNQYHFHWLSGDDVVQSLVHNFDRSCWALGGKSALKCHGMGGRSTLHGEIYGDVFDHHAVVYEFAGGVRVYGFCRTIENCYNENSSVILGTKGRCNLARGTIEGETNWKYQGPRTYATPESNPYLAEHVALFKAIRSGNPINSGDYMIRATLMAIMGQISCYSGKEVTWEQAAASDFYFAPKPEEVRRDMAPPTRPNTEGIYPVAYTPGVSKLL